MLAADFAMSSLDLVFIHHAQYLSTLVVGLWLLSLQYALLGLHILKRRGFRLKGLILRESHVIFYKGSP